MNIKQKICLTSGLAIIIAILLFAFFVQPLLREIKSTSLSLEEKKEKLNILEKADQKYLEQLEIDYEEIKKDISLIESAFLDADRAVDFIVELETFASLTFNALEIRKVDYPIFSLRTAGGFSGLMKYLAWLENGRYFVSVDSINIRRISTREVPTKEVSAGDVETILEINLPVKAYEEN